MWLMFAIPDAAGLDPVILVVDHVGEPRCVVSSVEDAIDWLGSLGQPEVGVPVGGDIEVYRIEPAGPPRLARRDLPLRRTLAFGDVGDGQPAGGAPTASYPAPAGNRRARRAAWASLRRRRKHQRRAGP